ncbi:DEAD/DEAH box helicase family protein [archaeon]|nr:DEAD/DEAH box helicase family protein [archaeon]
MKITMHNYQRKAHVKIWKAFVRKKRVLAVMATGLGKTIVAAFCALTLFKKKIRNGKRCRVLFLCHDNGILEQSVEEFRKVLGKKYSFGIFHGQEKVYDEVDVLFASFQTLGGNKNRDGWKEAFLEDEFDFVIVDESHHSHAGTYKPVIDYFKPRYLLGITATPDRMDKKNIREIFGKEVVNYPLEKAIAKGWLTFIEYQIITDNLNTPALQKLAREVLHGNKRVSIKQLNETIFVKVRDEEIAKRIMEHGKKTLIFCESILHTKNFQPFIPGSEICHSKRSYRENQKVLQKFRDGKTQYVLSVNKFNEGIDIPDVELVVFLRCTDSETVFWQQLGRGLRKIPGKKKVVVLDFVANCDRVAMIKDLTKRVEGGSEGGFMKDALYLSGKTFKFVFSEEFREIADIINKIKLKRRISDIPELAAEYMAPPKNLLPAEDVVAGTNKKVWWKCSKCGYERKISGNSRIKRKKGCLACVGRVVTENNNLSVTHPELAREYMAPPKNKLPANEVLAGTNDKVWWKCLKCGHEWKAAGNNRARGKGCPKWRNHKKQ